MSGLIKFDTLNKQRAASLLSTKKFFGLSIVDYYWIAEGISGASMAYYGLATDSIDSWFGGNAATVGVIMVVAAFFRVANFLEEEVNMLASVLILVLAANAGGAKKDIENMIDRSAPTFSYNANVAQPRNCTWKNIKSGATLNDAEIKWCKETQSDKCACN